MLERVEDEVEAVCERGREVVAVLGDVPGDDPARYGNSSARSPSLRSSASSAYSR